MYSYSETVFVNREDTGINIFKTTNFIIAYYSAKYEESKINEDSGAVLEAGDNVIAVVADGMGGHKNGDKASKTIIDSIRSKFKGAAEESSVAYFIEAIDLAQRKITKKFPSSGSTMVAAVLSKDKVRFFNIGDSVGILAGKVGSTKYRTIEHSPLGFAQESGLIEKEEIEHESHFVSNVLGSSPMRVELSQSFRILKSDTILLTSDGLLANISDEEIEKILKKKSIERVIESLVEKAKRQMASLSGHPDDLTVIVIKKRSDTNSRK